MSGHAGSAPLPRGAAPMMVLAAVITLPAVFGLAVGLPQHLFGEKPEVPVVDAAQASTKKAEIVLEPGTARIGPSGSRYPISVRAEDGTTELDFGNVPGGMRRHVPGVVRLRSQSSIPVILSVSMSPSLSGVVSVPRHTQSVTVEPGQTFVLALDVKVRRSTPPGDYDGELHVDQGNQGRLYSIPVHVMVIPNDPGD